VLSVSGSDAVPGASEWLDAAATALKQVTRAAAQAALIQVFCLIIASPPTGP
jgi:hypothetical protein